MGNNLSSVTNLMARNHFCGITELDSEKTKLAENFSPSKNGKFMLQILDPKNGLQMKFETQEYGTHTPLCKHVKYPLVPVWNERSQELLITTVGNTCRLKLKEYQIRIHRVLILCN